MLFLVLFVGGKGETLFLNSTNNLVLIIWRGEGSWLKCLKLKLMVYFCYWKFLHSVYEKVELDEIIVLL